MFFTLFYSFYFDADVKQLTTFIDSYFNHSKTWNKKMKLLEERIQNEMKRYGDILLVDQVDFYRNLPDKLLKSLTWLRLQNTYPTHVLKTDDDCYLNIDNIFKMLKTNSISNFTLFARYSWFS